MRARLRTWALMAAGLLAVAAAALWAWLPWDPLEGPAGPLAALVPGDVDAVVRLDPTTAAAAPFVAALRAHPAVVRWEEEARVEERWVVPLRAAQARLAEASRGLLAEGEVLDDLLGREAVVALRGDGLLVLTRISARARAVELVRKLSDERRADLGITVDGDLLALEREGLPRIHVARHRDVLALSTDEALVREFLDLCGGTGGSLAEVADASIALGGIRGPGARVFLWTDPSAFEPPFANAAPGSDFALWDTVLPWDRLGPVGVEVDLSSPDSAAVRITGSYVDGPPAVVGSLARGEGLAGDRAGDAARFALPEDAIAVAGVSASAQDVVRALVGAQPASRRALFEDLLAEQGTDADSVAAELGRHLEDGAGVVVARLQEADGLALDHWDEGQVHAIPATLVVLRLRDPGGAPALVADVARRAQTLFGADLAAEPDAQGIHRLTGRGLGLEWKLLRPAFAVVGDRFVFSTNEDYLERALARGRDLAVEQGGGGAVSVRLATGPLRRHVDDQRWEFAQRATFHDWARERAEFRRAAAKTHPGRSAVDLRLEEDAEIARRVERRNLEEFPAAIEAFRLRWEWLEVLDGLDATARVAGGGFTVEASIRPERP